MADSFQNEVPPARVNIKLDLHTGNTKRKLNYRSSCSPLVITVMAKSNDRSQKEAESTLIKTTSMASWLNWHQK
jgi:type VI secretion system protein ImpB